jgi:hypothetical protein
VPLGTPTAITLFGKSAREHELLSEHLAAEASEPLTLRGETFDKWAPVPGRPDNDWLDCAVGCAVAAAIQGLAMGAVVVPGGGGSQAPVKRKSLRELYDEKHGGPRS